MNETLIRWIAEGATAAETVARGIGFGPINPADTEGLTGVQILAEMMAGRLPVPLNAAHECFVVLLASEHAGSILQGMPQEAHLNPMGTVHGGWMATLMDSAMGNAVMALLPAGYVTYTTMNMHTEYRKSMPRDVGAVRVSARVLPGLNTSKSMMAEASIFGPDGTVYASATAEFRVPRAALC